MRVGTRATAGEGAVTLSILAAAPRRRDRASRRREPGRPRPPPRAARAPRPRNRAVSRSGRPSRARSASGFSARGDSGATRTIRRARAASGAKTPGRSLSERPPKRRSTRPERPVASRCSARAEAPGGLWAPSRRRGLAPARSSVCRRPGQRTAARPRATVASSSGATARAAASASARFCLWCAPGSAKSDVRRPEGSPRGAPRSAAPRRGATARGPSAVPDAPTSAGWPFRKIPAFSRATSSSVGPRTSRWSARDVRHDRDLGRKDVRRIEPPSDPDLHDGRSGRARAETARTPRP